MQENLKISYERTYDRKDWQGGTRLGLSTLQGGGSGNPRRAACVFLDQTLTSSPRGRQWSFPVKILNFVV